MDVDKEIEHLVGFIKNLGAQNEDGQWVVTYGTLFGSDKAQNTFESLFGTLRAARRRKVIDFKGQILLQGRHDDVPITLLDPDFKKG